MKTIEAIRLENYRSLILEMERERGHEMKDPEVAEALGISKVYAWQIRKGKRNAIDSSAARKIEKTTGKPEGWLDADFSLWPFPGIDHARYMRLTDEQKIEIQGSVRKMMIEFEDASGGALATEISHEPPRKMA